MSPVLGIYIESNAWRISIQGGNHPKKMGVLQRPDDLLTIVTINKKQSA
jgi:hypothetical protein